MSMRDELGRVLRAPRSVFRWARAHPLLSAAAREEHRTPGFATPRHAPHRPYLVAAVDWLARAQDVTGTGGIARGYSLTWNQSFGSRGWQPAYPETTGYIIPTLFEAARVLADPGLAQRARRAAEWEIDVQMPGGAVQGGVLGDTPAPAIFNTGQVLLGWLAAFEETGDERFATAARAAARYLTSAQAPDGHWRQEDGRYALSTATLYNARVAWAMAEAGVTLGEQQYLEVARRNLEAVCEVQHRDGWFPDCCLSDPAAPLLHTIAYTIRGLLEGGRVLGRQEFVEAGARAARGLLLAVRPDGWMSGRFRPAWSPAATWSCLTGEAQMATNWMRLYEINGDRSWLDPVESVLAFLKGTQRLSARCDGLRGGIKGSFPVSGDYGRYEVLNWATKYFADALMRHDRLVREAEAGPGARVHRLA